LAYKGGAKNFRYKVSNINSVFNAVRSIYDELTKQREELDKIGRFARDRIVAETRKGNDLTRDGAKQPELSESYIAWRRGVISLGKVRESRGTRNDYEKAARISGKNSTVPDPTFFRPTKSNLTMTGQLLNSIEYTVKVEDSKIIIEPTGTRDDGKTNKEVAYSLAHRKNKRTFLGLDDRGFKRIRTVIVEAIRRLALKKGL